jgi:hypothetical protein
MKMTSKTSVQIRILPLLGLFALVVSNQLLAQVPAFSATRANMIALGKANATAEQLFATLKKMAGKDIGTTYTTMPDWTGLWTVDLSKGFAFDNAQGPNDPPTARLTPEYQVRFDKKIALVRKGLEFDPLGRCDPPGSPRWLQEPFLREFVVTPKQTWLMNEVANETRRIYTDGRDHLAPEDRFTTWDGDSTGFWSGNKLVMYTVQLHQGQYQRDQPDYSDQIEMVEIWEKADDKTIKVHAWAYDPASLREAWYAQKTYLRLTNADKSVRIHFWHCMENSNNDVIQTEDGGTQFKDSSFTRDDGKKK